MIISNVLETCCSPLEAYVPSLLHPRDRRTTEHVEHGRQYLEHPSVLSIGNFQFLVCFWKKWCSKCVSGTIYVFIEYYILQTVYRMCTAVSAVNWYWWTARFFLGLYMHALAPKHMAANDSSWRQQLRPRESRPPERHTLLERFHANSWCNLQLHSRTAFASHYLPMLQAGLRFLGAKQIARLASYKLRTLDGLGTAHKINSRCEQVLAVKLQ